MLTLSPVRVCLNLTVAIGRTRTLPDIYEAALGAISDALGVERAAVLLFDHAGVMRFCAWRGLSDQYRAAVEGHTPWGPETADPQAIFVPDVSGEGQLRDYAQLFTAEGIGALGFIPLVSRGRVIGQVMLHYPAPRAFTTAERELAELIAAQVAFAVERTLAEDAARRSEERLRFALDAAEMGTWEWDLTADTVRWSDNLERIHGLPPGTFDGSFGSYEREIHPDDRQAVLASIARALESDAPHDVEYRLVAPDGTIRWAEGKGRVERVDGRAVRMSGVCMIVTRRKEAELARLESAREIARQKDEFLAVLSHELRTPLNAILGWLHILQRAPQRMPEIVEIIGRNARQQAQLIEDVLDVSRIITGKLEIERFPVPLDQVLHDALVGAEPAAEARRITLAADVPVHLAVVEGDARRLRQVFDNLLGNALKFSEDGGRVSLGAAIRGNAVMVEVADSGAGIEPDVLPYVFDRFRQGDSRTTRRHGGLGLGLAIARHLVEAHGGRIGVRSDGPGRGATFTVELPLSASLTRSNDVPGPDGVVARTAGLRVLIIDDHRDSRELLRELLASVAGDILEASSGAEALEVLARGSVHVILADLAMPGMDGFALIAEVRRRHGPIPAIAVSALARPEDRQRAEAAGFDEFHVKPIQADRILDAVRRVAALRAQN